MDPKSLVGLWRRMTCHALGATCWAAIVKYPESDGNGVRKIVALLAPLLRKVTDDALSSFSKPGPRWNVVTPLALQPFRVTAQTRNLMGKREFPGTFCC